MSRLTKRVRCDVSPMILKLLNLEETPEECIEVVGTDSKTCDEVCEENQCSSCVLSAVFEKLAHYEDLEEQGRLIELPCKVGDTIWAIFPTWTPMECEVVAIEILTSTVNIEAKVVDNDADRIFWPADFGKTVFLTKEEAEAKPAEINNRDAINTEVNYSDAMNVYRELNTHDREKSVSELAELKGTEE